MGREVGRVAHDDLRPQGTALVLLVAEAEGAGNLGDVRTRVVARHGLGLVACLAGPGHHLAEDGGLLPCGLLRRIRTVHLRRDADQRAGVHEGRARVLGPRGAPGQQPGVVGHGLVLEDGGAPVSLLPVPARFVEEGGARPPVAGTDGAADLLVARAGSALGGPRRFLPPIRLLPHLRPEVLHRAAADWSSRGAREGSGPVRRGVRRSGVSSARSGFVSGASATAASNADGSNSAWPRGRSSEASSSVQGSRQRARPCRTYSPSASCRSPARSPGLANSRATRPVASRALSDVWSRSAICHCAPASIASSASVTEPSPPVTPATAVLNFRVDHFPYVDIDSCTRSGQSTRRSRSISGVSTCSSTAASVRSVSTSRPRAGSTGSDARPSSGIASIRAMRSVIHGSA